MDSTFQGNTSRLQEIQIVLDLLMEYTAESDNPKLGKILEQLESSARDSITGISWKSDLPTDDEIKNAAG